MLFESFTKGPRGYPYIFIITEEVTTLEPIYGPLLLTIGSLSMGKTSTSLMVSLPLKWVCMPCLSQIFLILSETLCVRYNNVTLGFNFIGRVLGTCSSLAVSSISNLPGGLVKPSLHLVQSPFGIFALA